MIGMSECGYTSACPIDSEESHRLMHDRAD